MREDLTGRKFGLLTVISPAEDEITKSGRHIPRWKCCCECGVERDIRAGTLVSGNSLSCGCYKYERLSELSKLGFGISKTEQFVNDFLSKYTEYYESQVIYPDLRGDSGYPLSYDFAIYKDGKVKLLIECQGKQHYQPVEYFGGEERFIIQQINDNKKRIYATKHDIPLLEIPYTCSTDGSIIQLLMTYNNGLFSYEYP